MFHTLRLTVIILILEETLTADLGPYGSGSHLQNASYFTSSHSPRNSVKSNSREVIAAPAFKTNENKLSDSHSQPCWLSEEFRIDRECSPCTEFEISSGTPSACAATGRKETIKCLRTGTVYRSCSLVVGLEKRHFWIFESLMLLLTVLGLGVVKLRWSQLERKTLKQIERRLASGY